MLNLTLVTSIAKSALVGAVATKLVDILVSTKINNKMEQNRWIRNTKLELFSKLTEDILAMGSGNIDEQLREINKTSAKIILLINDRKLTHKIETYIDTLIKLKNRKKIESSVEFVNKDMISYLQRNIRIYN
jgi:phosphotransacetylase